MPPPYETPNAPIRFVSIFGRAMSQWKRLIVSWSSRGPSRENRPPDSPCARAAGGGGRGGGVGRPERDACLSEAQRYDRRVDRRPVGVFDSGVGGLTVLHECLVTLPHEDFLYLGDHARLPYGPRPLDEVRRFAREIGAFLEAQGVKLVVAACNTATSAALPQLQEELAVPVVGVITPEAHAAVLATRNRRIGLLATEATVEAGRYAELVRTLDAGVEVFYVACT